MAGTPFVMGVGEGSATCGAPSGVSSAMLRDLGGCECGFLGALIAWRNSDLSYDCGLVVGLEFAL